MTFKTKGTKEWAVKNINICDGCSNNCVYCYAKATRGRFDEAIKENWGNMKLKSKYNAKKRYGKYDGAVMFPSSHDITPANINECIITLKALLSAGNHVIIVTKANFDCVHRLCNELFEYRQQIILRFTITTLDTLLQKLYEPNAPSWNERMTALCYAYGLSFKTSVSMEPFLEPIGLVPETIIKLQSLVSDTLWLGIMNKRYCPPALWDEHKWGDAAINKLNNLLHDDPHIDWAKLRYKDAIRHVLEQ